MFFRKRRPQMQLGNSFELDTRLLNLSPNDSWMIRDACEGVQIFGATGSGKTSGSGATLARAYLSAGFGGLVLCAKPEERRLWEEYAQETGRSDHLVVFSPTSPWRFNFLDYELRRNGNGGGLTENLVNLFTCITEIVEGKQDAGGGDSFWHRAMFEMIRNAIELLSLSKGTVTLQDLHDLVITAPQNIEDLGNKEWQNTSFCAECLMEGSSREKTPLEEHDFETCSSYWMDNYANLAYRTRSSIVAHFTSIADVLLHGITWDLLCTTTNIVPEVTYKDGAIIVLDLPIQEYQEVGRIAQSIFKYVFQRAILRRNADVDTRPIFLWADEAQNFISSYDHHFQATARSARACSVYLTQNISNYLAALGGRGKDGVYSLLGNFQTQIFHANGDFPTNQFAADTISQKLKNMSTYNVNHNDQGSGTSSGGSQQMHYKVTPEEFTTLRKGGPPNNGEVDAIVFQGGRKWNATQQTYIKTIFKQR